MSPAAADGSTAVYLLDIEGTTTPITFVTDVLFPYARRHLAACLEDLRAAGELQRWARAFETAHRQEIEQGATPPPWRTASDDEQVASIRALALWLMDRDRKTTVLKDLQGHIWKTGYENSTLQGEVYDDVVPALRHWRRQGARIAIFSSGSVPEEKLLFGHTTRGDLTGLIDAYFDTGTGPKREAESYRQIAAALDAPPETMLFLSDVVEELDAAREAGLRTALCVRDTPPEPTPPGRHPVLTRFDEPPAGP